MQTLLCARDCDIEQTTLLFLITLLPLHSLMREESLFKASDEYRIELKTLSGMHSHECYAALFGFAIELILVPGECSVRKKCRDTLFAR